MSIQIKKEVKLQANAFSVLRFLSAIAIVLFHYNKLTGGEHSDIRLPFFIFFGLSYSYGGRLVELFFIISGFVFLIFYKDRIFEGDMKFLRFIIHRFARVLPSYWLSTTVIIIFTLLSSSIIGTTIKGAGGNITNLISLLLNLFCLDFSNPINGVAWFVAVDLVCYIWYYIILALKAHEYYKYIITFISIVTASVLVPILVGNPLQNIVRGIASFGVGGVLALLNNNLAEDVRKQLNISWVSIMIFIGTIVFYTLIPYIQDIHWFIEVYLLFPSLILFITNCKVIREFMSLMIFKDCGKYSFSIYIFQTAGMSILYFILGLIGYNNWYLKSNLILTMMFIITFGIIMYHLWEIPMNKLTKNLEGKINEKYKTISDC